MKLSTIRQIVIHHSATKSSQKFTDFIKAIDRGHKERLHKEVNGLGNHIAYHYMISPDGVVKETRPLDEVGYHAGRWLTNLKSVGICLQGDFTKEDLPVAQLEAAKTLVFELREKFGVKPEDVLPHKAIKATACPGLSDDEMNYIANGKPAWMEKLEDWADQYVTDMPRLLSGDVHSMIALIKRSHGEK